MKKILLAILTIMIADVPTQAQKKTYILSDAPRFEVSSEYGYDLVASPTESGRTPFFFSVRVPDGNYKVTVKLGSSKYPAMTTVRGESRRLYIDKQTTAKDEFTEQTFIVNKRTPYISDGKSVHIKQRERTKLNWDDKLTLEFNGDRPACESITIEPADTSVITVFLCGNSTVVDQDNEPWASWGQMIPCFFNDKVSIANYAESGECANTFIAALRLEKILSQMKAGDYLFIEFGHNDQKQKGPGTGAYYSYMTNLKIFIDEARLRGAYPVLVTPTQRRSFDKNGHIRDTHEDYPEAMKWLAVKEDIPLIDLHAMTRTLYEALGMEQSKKAFVHYPAGTYPRQTDALKDNTHFNPYGAYEIAKCVIEGVKKTIPALAVHLKPCPPFDPASPDDPDKFIWHDSPFTEIEKPDGN